MKYTEHEFNGVNRRLSFTAGALFRLYEKYGYTSNIVNDLKLMENSSEGWNNTCWLYALCAEQGNLQLKALYMEPQPLITYEQLRTQAAPVDVPYIKNAVLKALEMGFKRDKAANPDEEVDLVLQEIEEAEKKKAAGALSSLLSFLRAATTSTTARETP